MLELEAFSARHGDALLLHYGTKAKPLLAMIDGGPSGVYKRVIASRLAELAPAGKVPRIRWVNVSHVDEDHITGVITLFERIRDDTPPPASVDALFHNVPTAGDALGVQPGAIGGGAAPSERDRLERELGLLIAPTAAAGVRVQSFQQGADLANLARDQRVHVARNPPAGKRLLTGDTFPAKHVAPLSITVVAPSLTRFQKLIDEWRKELGPAGGVLPAATKTKLDTRVANLSSLVLLVQQGTKKLLLTGDARADHTVEGLEELGLLGPDGKPLVVDVLKLPHHGSDSTTDLADDVPGLLERVRARHYVISADGRFKNPSEGILRRLVQAQGKRKATVWLTTAEGQGGTFGPVYAAALAALRDEIAVRKANITVEVPAAGQRSVVVPLEK